MVSLSKSSNAQPVWIADPATGDAYKPGGNQDASGNTITTAAPLTAGTNRSGTAGTTASTLAPANTSRVGLEVQNISANNIGINEIGGTAAIGTAGTYTVAPGGSFRVRTNRAISVIAASASSAYTATEW